MSCLTWGQLMCSGIGHIGAAFLQNPWKEWPRGYDWWWRLIWEYWLVGDHFNKPGTVDPELFLVKLGGGGSLRARSPIYIVNILKTASQLAARLTHPKPWCHTCCLGMPTTSHAAITGEALPIDWPYLASVLTRHPKNMSQPVIPNGGFSK